MMKVEILHKQADGQFILSQTVDVVSTSDVASCELAYFHTMAGSVSHIQNPALRATEVGDIVVVVPDDEDAHRRAFILESVECDTGTPVFAHCDVPTVQPNQGA